MTGKRMLVLVGALAGATTASLLSAAELHPPRRLPQPHVVAGGGFATDIVLLNSSTTTCEFAVVAHREAGSLAREVVVDGRPGGVRAGFLDPGIGREISIESPDGRYVGAVSVDVWTPGCFNAFSVQTRTRVFGPGGAFLDQFSYSTPRPLGPGECALAATRVDTDSTDGRVRFPGFASASLEKVADARLCHTLNDDEGRPIGDPVCFPTDGSHQARLLSDVFGAGASGTSWQVCLDSPADSRPSPRLGALFMHLEAAAGATRFDVDEHQVQRPGCREDEFNACLNDRFQVSAGFRSSPLGPMRRGRVGSLLPEQTGYFTFRDEDTLELAVQVVNGCAINDRFWVFAAATTAVQYEITVVDTRGGKRVDFTAGPGDPSASIVDVEAFDTCP